MTANSDLLASAQLSEAAYASLVDDTGRPLAVAQDLVDALKREGWSDAQANVFSTQYRVVHQQPNTSTGFSATLFEKLNNGVPTGQYVFAARGTELSAQLFRDIAVDIGDLVSDGLAWSQILDMYNYWTRLTTPAGETYQQAQLVTIPDDGSQALGTYIRDTGSSFIHRIVLAPATDGIGAISAGSPLQVVGHSLGGHLASAFTRLFPNIASQAYSINGAGYAEVLGNANINYVFSTLGGGDWFSAADVQNFYGSAGPDIVTQNAPSGLVQVGSHDMIYIERGGLGEDPRYWFSSAWGHSAMQMSDSAAVYDLLIRLDVRSNGSPSEFLPQLLPLFEAAAQTRGHTLEGMTERLARFFGMDGNTIVEDDREALYARIKQISDSATFRALAGRASITPTHDWITTQGARDPLWWPSSFDPLPSGFRPQTDFAALLSLTAGATFSLRLDDPSPTSPGSLALYAANRPQYERWLADIGTRAADPSAEYRGSLNYTTTYLNTRAAFLNTLIAANTADEGFANSPAVTRRYTFVDMAPGTDRANDTVVILQPGAGSLEEQRLVFGSSVNDRIEGFAVATSLSGVNTPNEFLFGGDGDDVVFGMGGRDYIEGGGGNDVIYGGVGNDLVLGNDGDDRFYVESGLLNSDQLYGGRGIDTYDFYGGATENGIWDTDGQGRVIYAGYTLNGANARLTQYDSVQVFQTDHYTYTFQAVDPYHLTSGLMIHHGGSKDSTQQHIVTISGWKNGDLGINLANLGSVLGPGGAAGGSGGAAGGGDGDFTPAPPVGATITYYPPVSPADYTPTVPASVKTDWDDTIAYAPRRDPLVIDLDRDGLELRAADGQVLFDHNADGIRTGTGWALPDDALLVWDRSANGAIDSGRELFGVDTVKTNGQFATDGFDALRDLDSNSDGVFDSGDTRYVNLRLWRDLNQNGLADGGELQGLAASGIASVSLNSTASGALVNNNRIDRTSVVTRSDGLSTTAGAIDFAENLFAREFTGNTVQGAVAITEAAQALPFMRGSGMVRDLREAMSLVDSGTGQLDVRSAALTGAVQAYAGSTSREAQQAQIDGLLRTWAATSNHLTSLQDSTAPAPGNTETAVARWARLNPSEYQKIEALERFNGINLLERRVVAVSGGFEVQLWADQVVLIDRAYATLRDNAYVGLLTQTRLARYANGIRLVTDGAGNTTLDTSGVAAAFQAARAAEPARALIDLAEFNRYAQGQAQTLGFDAAELLGTWMSAEAADSPLRIDLAGLDVFGGTVIEGTTRADFFAGDASVNSFTAGAGDDIVHLGDGDDSTNGGYGADLLLGGAGSDTMRGNSAWNWSQLAVTGAGNNDIYDGGAGNDALIDEEVSDGDVYRLKLGGGHDVVVDGGGIGDSVELGRGIDANGITIANTGTQLVVTVTATGERLTINNAINNGVVEGADGAGMIEVIRFADGTAWDVAAVKQAAVRGTAGADTIRGFADADAITSGSGDDTVRSLAGNDTLDVGDGADWANAGYGADVLLGGAGNDTLYGNSAWNWSQLAVTGAGNNDIYGGGTGNDTLIDEEVSDGDVYRLALGDGQDTIIDGGGALDRIEFGVGIDPLGVGVVNTGTALEVTLAATSERFAINNAISNSSVAGAIGSGFIEEIVFADGTIWGEADIKRAGVRGSEGADTIRGFAEADAIVAGAGDDTVQALAGNDTLDLGDGTDWANAGYGADTLSGGAGNDTLYGNSAWNWSQLAATGPGNSDTYDGGGGGDALIDEEVSDGDVYRLALGGGQDTITDGGGAADRIEFGSAISPSELSVRNTGTQLVVTVEATGEGLTINNALTNSMVDGADGAGMIEEMRFADGTIWEQAAIKQAAVRGSDGPDTIRGFAADDSIASLAGDDTVRSLAGSDTIDLGDGTDWANAGYGADLLLGGTGNDTLYGNSAWSWSQLAVTGAGNNDTYDGGAGNDTLIDEEVSDGDIYRLRLGGGQDTITDGGGTDDRIEFGAGIDVAEVAVRNLGTAMLVTVQTAGAQLTVNSSFDLSTGSTVSGAIEQIVFADGTVWDQNAIRVRAVQGSDAADAIRGFSSGDVIATGHGADSVQSLAGDDSLDLGDDADWANAGYGADTLLGGTGNDTLYGNSAWNWSQLAATGVGNNDTYDGGSGNDVLIDEEVSDGDVYRIGLGGGQDTVTDGGGIADQIAFGAGIASQDVTVRNTGSALTMTLASGERVVVNNAFDSTTGANASGVIEEVWFAGGIVWNQALIRAAAVLGTSAADTIRGFSVDDSIIAGAGNDSVQALGGTDTVDMGDGDDWANAGYGADILLGGAGNDTLYGNSAWNWSQLAVTGPGNNDAYDGGAGNDTLIDEEVSDGDSFRFGIGGGQDTITDGGGIADRIEFTAGVAQSDLLVTRSANTLQVAIAGTIDRVSIANWFLSASAQFESFTFADGTSWDSARIAAAIMATQVGTGAADILNGSTGPDWLQGLAGNDTIDGAAGNDRLDGGLGADTMRGGLGDDTYEVDNAADVVTESTNEGFDTVRSAVTWALGTNLEDLALIGNGAINAIGNSLNNRLWGNGAANRMDGGTGADTMTGRAGDDTYLVDSVSDTIMEATNEGNDTAESSVSFMLGVNVENISLTGTAALSATGNDLANVLLGNSAANTLSGGAGNDTLNGGAGADSMAGGTGDDTYFVNSTADVVAEAVNEGIDTVSSSITWTLGANVENLTLTGTTATNGTGNILDNVLIGNAGNNTLSGGAGNDVIDGGAGSDTMTGSTGNDVYRVDNTKDKVTENAGGGTDRIESTLAWTLAANFEDLTLSGNAAVNATGNTANNVLVGNSAANTLSGLAGNDTLDGGAGNDALIGGAGADTYRFGAGRGVDTVQENDATAGIADRIDFGALLQAQLSFARVGNNMEASILGNGIDKLIVKDWYMGTQYQVEQFAFGDGSALTNAQVQGLVSAMGAFSGSATADAAASAWSSKAMLDRSVTLAVQTI